MLLYKCIDIEEMKILYVSDLDGTLLSSQKVLSEYTIRTMNQFVEKGMLFTYATARSLSSASKVTSGLSLQTPIVAYNGAHIFHPQTGERISSEGFTKEEVQRAKEIFEKYQLVPMVYSFVENKETVSWVKGTETKGVLKYIQDRLSF